MEKPLNDIITCPKRRANLESRYWPKVNTAGSDDCWEWGAKARTAFGYGRMTAGRRVHLKAHQIAWALQNGPIPIGLSVCHACDNPRCCNPDHLFLGTTSENMQDAGSKGRMRPPRRYGADNRNTKLSAADIVQIRADKRPARVIAEQFGVSEKTIYRVRWGHRKPT